MPHESNASNGGAQAGASAQMHQSQGGKDDSQETFGVDETEREVDPLRRLFPGANSALSRRLMIVTVGGALVALIFGAEFAARTFGLPLTGLAALGGGVVAYFAAALWFFNVRRARRIVDRPELQKAREKLEEAANVDRIVATDGATVNVVDPGPETERLRLEVRDLQAQLDAVRHSASVEVARNLGASCAEAASDAERRVQLWAIGLWISILALAGAVYWMIDRGFEQETTAATIAAVASGVVVLGVPLYLVRLTSGQFKQAQYIAQVLRNRESILGTFSLFVAAQPDEETRKSLTDALTKEIFSNPAARLLSAPSEPIAPFDQIVASLSQGLGKPQAK